ncbi:thioredoxin domain-containing protein [Pedobacter cryotolerans]|uniref:Thioredoxin domain-containing protein n=1 Tax=Pedobacter cryotolerans TaxID=2571270 RepID=A0A4V5NXU4_9SPHI|nr:thioredoxin domain-containing protein [Pedobacter cryotolerans]TKB99965.1 thioredoxin domain-containing protein [Pedobacter cryotolerans]
MQEPNNLIHASSPYLLQHAYNPVEWHEWNAEALEKAKKENKLILVSIGYSACHWCHVMEHESFENFEVAEVMNKHFVCIKVDREERPDIDQIYMLAVQLMNGNGGWPLNAICLPDQRPIYGGTYFRKNDWINILENVADLWKNEPDKAKNYAERLTDGINQAEKIIPATNELEFELVQLEEIIEPWKRHFDINLGGYNRAPKFPLPNNWSFLLRYSFLAAEEATFMATCTTLEQMSMGGIYDQIGGGFARYSVDDKWHVPHFEKMLYDNAQLMSLYAEAYQCLKFKPFVQVIVDTIDWTFREMSADNGLFFSALDADSEGVEGKFYVWDKSKFDEILGEDATLMAEYFDVTEHGNWEEEHTNILRRTKTDEEILEKYELDAETLYDKVALAKAKLLDERSKRIRPGLDDKCLTAWNAMMIKALCDASQVLNYPAYYERAKLAANFMLDNLVTPDGGLFRNYKNGKASIIGFLDDYAFMIEALIALYEVDFNEEWLDEAKSLTNYVINHFNDAESDMFFYTAANGEALIARKHEVMDNVIPASNSVMAQNLQKLGLFYDEENCREKASAMLKSVLPRIKAYGSAYSNWSIQLLNEVYGINEIAIVGNNVSEIKKEFSQKYIPNKIVLGGIKSELPLLKGKESEEPKIYVCRNKTCQLPVNTVEEALNFIN